jgi:RNA polymerase sigma-70 factor (ECF subfamily)
MSPARGQHAAAELEEAVPVPAAGTRTPNFDEVFQAHAAYVLGFLRRLGVAVADVEDVGQEVFMAIHAGLPTFEGRSALKTWICGICLRRAADYRRKVQRRRAALADGPPEPSGAAEPDERLGRKQQAAEVARALSQLPEKQLQVFVLYEIEELPMAEVARAVGCPRFTAYTRLHAARRRIRALFGGAPRERSGV